MKLTQATLYTIVAQTAAKTNIHGAVFKVQEADGGSSLSAAAGNLQQNSPYYIASINKIMIAALTLRLVRAGKLQLNDKVVQYLPSAMLKGLLVHKGVDYAHQITIRQLLSHTSGLPCYLIDKGPDGKRNMQQIWSGNDQAWPIQKVADAIKNYKPHFAPGSRGKAAYGETGFRLLDQVLEIITGQCIDVLLTKLFAELDMHHTYVLAPGSTYPPVYHKQKEIRISNYAASTYHEVASTAHDQMLFVQAFFNGYFYPKEKLKDLEQWNRIFFPFHYGIGLQQFSIPRFFSPFQPIPKMIGHCGSVGSAAFYIPNKKVYITGTVNQTSSPSVLF